ncbi:MAG: gamma-glutamylcyclotransferase [Bryobacteraceae bacterium]|nr:gamma-glutamylcyclotransferase [Bryobacteraceae bacterium]
MSRPGNSVVKLGPGESAIFGYGSLLSIASLERTLGRKYGGPFLPCTLVGWRRSWDIAIPNSSFYTETEDGRMVPEMILYLNVRRDPATRMNGILFVVNQAELAKYDEREWVYDREDVTAGIDLVVEGGSAYAYVGKDEYVRRNVSSPRQAAIRATYIQIVENGLAGLGDDFRSTYLQSSDPVPQHLVIQDQR